MALVLPIFVLIEFTGITVVLLLIALVIGYLLRYIITRSHNQKYQDRIDHLEISLQKAHSERDQLVAELEAYRSRFEAHLPKADDLKIVEGIGPKIESLLKEAGIHNWQDLAHAELSNLQKVLKKAGDRYRVHNPGTWSQQANLASQGKWEELEQLQTSLSAGRK